MIPVVAAKVVGHVVGRLAVKEYDERKKCPNTLKSTPAKPQ